MKNRNVWRYIFYYNKYASRDKYYFDIITDQGKKVARELALKEVSEIKDWFVLTLVTKRLHIKGEE